MAISQNLDADSTFTFEQFGQEPAAEALPVVLPTGTIFVSSINGINGSITFSGGSTGLTFGAAGATVTLAGTLAVANGGTGATTAAGARTSLGAAASGVNTDISQLNGASQVDVSTSFKKSGVKVVGAQGASVADVASADATDLATALTLANETKAQLNTLLARLRAATGHGLIA